MQLKSEKAASSFSPLISVIVGMMIVMLACPFNIFSENRDSTRTAPPDRHAKPVKPSRRHSSPITNLPDSFPIGQPLNAPSLVVLDSVALSGDSLSIVPIDSVAVANAPLVNPDDSVAGLKTEKVFTFTPNPTKAVWMSALFPGLGQLYNRRYWKLPIVVGAYMGLGYATNWNNTMLRDYTRAYSDIMDNDPSTNSYMDFFAPTVKEEDLDKRWLTDLLRRRKNMYRRNRDLCIISMVGVYLLAMVDAYVDASLSHFDVSPDLSMDIAPAIIPEGRGQRPAFGLQWALNF